MPAVEIFDIMPNFYWKTIEPKFYKLYDSLRGLVGPGTCQFLNDCTRLIEKDECYFEVGTFQGMSLVGASLGHDKRCYSIDNFSETFNDNKEKYKEFRSPQDIIKYNLDLFRVSNARFLYGNYLSFFANNKDIFGKKIGVYFYDGGHSFEDQVDGILKVENLLSDNAVIVIDDLKSENVSKAIKYVCDKNKKFIKIKEIDNETGYGQGIVVLKYKR